MGQGQAAAQALHVIRTCCGTLSAIPPRVKSQQTKRQRTIWGGSVHSEFVVWKTVAQALIPTAAAMQNETPTSKSSSTVSATLLVLYVTVRLAPNICWIVLQQ